MFQDPEDVYNTLAYQPLQPHIQSTKGDHQYFLWEKATMHNDRCIKANW